MLEQQKMTGYDTIRGEHSKRESDISLHSSSVGLLYCKNFSMRKGSYVGNPFLGYFLDEYNQQNKLLARIIVNICWSIVYCGGVLSWRAG